MLSCSLKLISLLFKSNRNWLQNIININNKSFFKMKENTHEVGDDFNIRNGIGQSNFNYH